MKDLSDSILLTEKLHFVRFQEKSLWKSPDLTPPPSSQSDPRPKSPDLTYSTQVMGTNQNPWPAREMGTNQNPLPQKVTNQMSPNPETPIFQISRARIPYISNVTQNSGLLPYSHCVGIGGSPSSSLVIKTLLLLHRISAPWWSLGDFATWAQHPQLEKA